MFDDDAARDDLGMIADCRRQRAGTCALVCRINLLRLLTICACLLVNTGLIWSPALARDFRAADIQASDYPTVQAIEHMARLIRERTGGRHGVTVFHSRQLGEESETIEQTRIGAIDINRINVAPLAILAPDLRLFGLPFLFRSEAHLYAVVDGVIGRELLSGLEGRGLIGLTYYDSGARSIYNSVRPVRSLADMKGLRIRVQQSEVAENMVRAMGAVPVVLPYGQVLTALTTRLIDGAENNWPSYVSTDHFRTARFYTTTEHSMAPEVLVMSKKAWESLDAGDREIFREAAHESSAFMRTQWRSWEERARRDAATAGNQIIREFDRSSFDNTMTPLFENEMRDPDLRAAVERIRRVF